MLMTWDDVKCDTNFVVHGLHFADARDRFEWETALVGETYANSKTGKVRFMAIGFLDDDLVALIFEPLGSEAISAISLRPASNKERRRYDQN